jgi:hypothetical protein
LRRADRAPRIRAAVFAVGRRVAHRILKATPPPTSRSAHRSTQVPKLRRLQSLIPASMRRAPVQLVPMPLIEAPTAKCNLLDVCGPRSKAQVQHGCRRACWDCRRSAWPSYASLSNRKRHARAYRNAHVDQNRAPNNLLVNEPSLSTQGIGGNCGRYDAYGSTFASLTLPGNRARKTLFRRPVRCILGRLARWQGVGAGLLSGFNSPAPLVVPWAGV